MSKIVPYAALMRQQHLNFLRHKRREYQQRENYLTRLRKLLFQVEAQMRQAEFQQMEMFKEMAAHFQVPLPFPDLGDRVGLQEFFAHHPFLAALREFFAGRLSPEACCDTLLSFPTGPPR